MKISYKKTLAALSMITVGALTAASCSAADDGGLKRNADGEIVVDLWHAQSGDAGNLLDKLVEQFNEEQQGKIEVNAVYQGSYEDNFAKLAATIQTGNVPTLMQASDVQTAYMKDSGITLPMQEALGEQGAEIRNNLLPAVSNYYVMDDELWSMPMFVSQPAAYINTDILKKAGVDPTTLVTFDDYLNAADKIYEVTGTPGLVFATSAWFNEEFVAGLNQMYCTPGNGVEGERADGLGFLNDEVYALWDRIQQGYEKGSIVDVGDSGSDGAALLTSGNVAMQFNSSGNVTSVQETGIPFTIRPLPRATEKAGAVPGGNSLWILKNNKSQEEIDAAAEFAKFVASDGWQERVLPESGYIPATNSAAEHTSGLPSQQMALVKNLVETPATTVTAGCHIGAMSQIRSEVDTAVQSVAKGTAPQEAFSKVNEAAELAIERYETRAAVTEK